MWCADACAGYEQQDAHEFLIASLNGIHTHLGGENHNCTCIVHKIFSGMLQSQITCTQCGNKSATHDPFLDISLHIPHNAQREYADTTLYDCLKRFIHPEELGDDQKIHCMQCGLQQPATKQLSWHTLPAVLCIHLKRFEYVAVEGRKGSSTKIDCNIAFPQHLDMAHYLAAHVDRANAVSTATRVESKREPAVLSDSTYELFAVVCHSGRMDSGHYHCYVAQRDEWYKCDDAAITSASLTQVLSSKAYILFYIRKYVDYT
jgi:ubiquitin carboxyl-terminal hydrolase 22/27/51